MRFVLPVIPATCKFGSLQDAAHRIEADLRLAEKEGWIWGAKTVRGAYMHQERALAAELSMESPIQESIADTHANYNRYNFGCHGYFHSASRCITLKENW